MDITVTLFYQPIYNLVIVLYRLFGGDLGLAIIAVAVLARILLFPLTQRQIRMAEQGRELNEEIKAVKEKYKNDKEKQSQELMKVQSAYLPGQLAGCLSLIVQLVLFVNILNVIRNLIAGVASFNAVAYPFIAQFPDNYQINGNFLHIVDLLKSANGVNPVGISNFPAVLPYIILAVLVGASQYSSTRIMMGIRKRTTPKADKEKKVGKGKKSAAAGGKAEAPDFSEIMEQSTRQTMIIIPFLAVSFALTVASGLSLYWTVQSGLVIIQQLLMERLLRSRNESGDHS